MLDKVGRRYWLEWFIVHFCEIELRMFYRRICPTVHFGDMGGKASHRHRFFMRLPIKFVGGNTLENGARRFGFVFKFGDESRGDSVCACCGSSHCYLLTLVN